MSKYRRQPEKRCSFCGKPRSAVKALVQGDGTVRICNECVRASGEAMAESERIDSAAKDTPLTLRDAFIYLNQHAKVLRAISSSDAGHVEELAQAVDKIAQRLMPPAPEIITQRSGQRPPSEEVR